LGVDKYMMSISIFNWCSGVHITSVT